MFQHKLCRRLGAPVNKTILIPTLALQCRGRCGTLHMWGKRWQLSPHRLLGDATLDCVQSFVPQLWALL